MLDTGFRLFAAQPDQVLKLQLGAGRFRADAAEPLSAATAALVPSGIPADSRAAVKGYEWIAERVTDPAKVAAVEKLRPIASDLGCTISQLALAWCLKNPNVSTVITGASRVSQVHENMKALDVAPKLTAEVVKAIEAATAV